MLLCKRRGCWLVLYEDIENYVYNNCFYKCGATEQNQALGCTYWTVKVCNLHGAIMVQIAHFHSELLTH